MLNKKTILSLLVILSPWQARLILKASQLNHNYHEYTTISLYLIGLSGLVLSSYYLIKPFNTHSTTKKQLTASTQPTKPKRPLKIWLPLLIISQLLTHPNLEQLLFFSFIFFNLALIYRLLIQLPAPNLNFSLILMGLSQALLSLSQFWQQKVSGWPGFSIAPQNPLQAGVSVISNGDWRLLRSYGSLPHPNILGGYLWLSLWALSYYYISNSNQNFKTKLFLNLSYGFIFSALLTSFSRNWILAWLISLTFFSFKYFKQNYQLLLISAAIMSTFIMWLPAPFQLRTGINSSHLETKSLQERLLGNQAALQIIKANWLWGVGWGNYTASLANQTPGLNHWKYQPVHNNWLWIIASSGFSGLLIILSLLKTKLQPILKQTPYLLSASLLLPLLLVSNFDHFFLTLWPGMLLLTLVMAVTTKVLLK